MVALDARMDFAEALPFAQPAPRAETNASARAAIKPAGAVREEKSEFAAQLEDVIARPKDEPREAPQGDDVQPAVAATAPVIQAASPVVALLAAQQAAEPGKPVTEAVPAPAAAATIAAAPAPPTPIIAAEAGIVVPDTAAIAPVLQVAAAANLETPNTSTPAITPAPTPATPNVAPIQQTAQPPVIDLDAVVEAVPAVARETAPVVLAPQVVPVALAATASAAVSQPNASVVTIDALAEIAPENPNTAAPTIAVHTPQTTAFVGAPTNAGTQQAAAPIAGAGEPVDAKFPQATPVAAPAAQQGTAIVAKSVDARAQQIVARVAQQPALVTDKPADVKSLQATPGAAGAVPAQQPTAVVDLDAGSRQATVRSAIAEVASQLAASADKSTGAPQQAAARTAVAEVAPPQAAPETPAPEPQLDATATARTNASPAATTPPALRQAPESVVQVYTRFVERFDGRAQRFDVSLEPAELGRVDVRIEVGADRKVHAVLAAHDSAALTDLMRGQRSLERALSDAGVDLADNGLRFELSQGSGRSFARSDQQSNPHDNLASAHAWRGFSEVAVPVEADDAVLASSVRSWRPARLNLVA